MCGITGFIDFKRNSSEEILKQMTDTLSHRGPDGSGMQLIEKENYQIGFGHRRLSIIDLSEHGKQPMSYNGLSICFNGEVYNFAEVKTELSKLGHQFIGSSDTEMILHAYQQWGEKCLEKFVGMFAFVIYNQDNETLFCARDRAGVKPFFYYFQDGLFMFASELKAFHKHQKFQKSINFDALTAFIQYGNVPTPYCIFNDCHKLNAGHTILIDLKKSTEKHLVLHEKKYWNVYDFYNKPKLNISFEEAKVETEKIIQSACDFRMVSDVPVGVFLSGGYDSACVASLLQKDNTEKIKTFTIGVPDIGLNEAPYAKDVAKHLGTDHTEMYCTNKEAINLIEDLPYFYDEPFADSSAIPTILVSRMARKKVTVALSADGGDEVFAGYNRYDYIIRYGNKLHKIPKFSRRILSSMMEKIPSEKIPVLKNRYNFHNRYEKLKGILKNPSEEEIMLSLSQQFTNDQLKKVMNYPPSFLKTSFSSRELQKEYFSPLSYIQAIDYQTYLLDDILQKVDRATMSASLEGREPLLDHRIIEWAAQLPNDYKYFKGNKKYILKEIVYQYVPKPLLNRPKMGFAIPIANWLQSDLKTQVEHYLDLHLIQQQGIFNPVFIEKLKKDFFSGKKELDTKIWYILMFQMWYDKWMN
jgi:asparagine synthase (glutamine-hydrolysing)